jgi:drug/metabolite transporter (DMT)-like permease
VLWGLTAALGAAAVFGVATVVQAVGARRVPSLSGVGLRMLPRLLREPAILAALVLNGLGFVLHLVALRLLPLYLAQAGIAASLVVTAALAVRLFGDRLAAVEWAAVGGVVVGLVLLTLAAGETGQQRAGAAFGIGLLAVTGGLALAGLVAGRSGHAVVPAVLGGLAGLAFAVDSIAVRVLPGLTPGALVQALPTYAFAASATLGFLLYSSALQRGAVTAATAPLIVTQTLGPALVGVLLLGDEVRPGLGAVAVVGLALTTAGAARLARFEGAPRAVDSGR